MSHADLLAPHIPTVDARETALGASVRVREIEDHCAEIDARATGSDAARAALEEVWNLIALFPHAFAPQFLAASLLERARVRKGMLETWTALHKRFPGELKAMRYRLRWLGREGHDDVVAALIEDVMEDGLGDPTHRLRLAELCSEIREPALASLLFQRLIDADPMDLKVRVVLGKYLFAKGDPLGAFAALDPVRDERLSPTAEALLDKNDRAIQAMEIIAPGSAHDLPDGCQVLENALALFNDRVPRPRASRFLRGISFFTGSLGAGGAERQLTRIATALHQRARNGRRINGTSIAGPVEVVVNHVDAARGKDFFLPVLADEGIPFAVTEEMPTQALRPDSTETELLADLAPLLPAHARYGLDRLPGHHAKANPDVAYIWQDGAVLTGALAALASGIPRIAISLRGLPPNLRPHLMKPEYPGMYRALATIPGISLSCNSMTAARAYADWLELPEECFSVLYNAVRPLENTAPEEEIGLWSAFAAATPDATHTIGGVFRFNDNKRPDLWLDMAEAALAENPRLRFVLLGDGERFDETRARAASGPLAKRMLFVGTTPHVGFWLNRFDLVAHLAENEGLPNVLIEAQMAGRPVVATPAGGTEETFAPGRTGILLSSNTRPDLRECTAAIHTLLRDPQQLSAMGRAAMVRATELFDLDTVLAQTVAFFDGARIHPNKRDAELATVSDFPTTPPPRMFEPDISAAYKVLAKP